MAKPDLKGLERALRRELEGEVRFDRGSIALYATDSSNFRQIPLGVVVPRTLEDVVVTHRLCRDYGAPILNRGGGTSLSGETVNTAVVIDHSKYLTAIGEPDLVNKTVTVQPGAINEQVNKAIGQSGYVFGPDPSSHSYCTIGGNIGNNSCGIHSVQAQLYGPGPRTSDNVHALDVVTYGGDRFTVGVNEEARLEQIIRRGGRQGEIYRRLRDLRNKYAHLIRERFRPVTELPRRVSGYNLDELLPERGFNVARALVGTESTCATALQATLMLTPGMFERATVVVAYDNLEAAGNHVTEIMEWKPIGLEAIDSCLFEEEQQENVEPGGLNRLPRPGNNAWFLVQFGADSLEEVEDVSRRFCRWLIRKKGYEKDRITVYKSREAGGDSETLWKLREAGLGATAFPPNGRDHWPGWEDSAVPPSKVGEYVRDLKRLYKKYGLTGAMYGHLGQGCIHSRISFDLRHADGVRRYRSFLAEASDLVVSYGGSLSGEHGDGQQRAEFLGKQYGPELVEAMREFKRIWDPDGRMNPGKVIDPFPVDANLKLGTNYNPPRPAVKFSYSQDGGDFAHAMLRCVGVGKCRQPDTVDVMCPSYAATHEEKHTTRGRARLLFEMLQGDVIKDGWQSEEVREALDLCLACKGCTHDCPVHVDMPTYKAEFLYHHFKGPQRRRQRHMYAFGFVDKVARYASLAPELANFFSRVPPFANLAKSIAGMDQRRQVPAFAPQTLQAWFHRRGEAPNRDGPPVVLWPDTFNNHFHTNVGIACVEALEAGGYRVLMPRGHVCCGRPLYDYGFLDAAGRYLKRTLGTLREHIRAGTPVVGMEPSCVAVFRDELPKMMPHDDDAARLERNVYHWAEFFLKHNVRVPRLNGKAVLWGHCHHKATGGMEPEMTLLRDRMGLEVEMAQGGCCGLAGSFGFEAGKYDISMKCGEVGLLPAARKAGGDALIIANGFSCRTQLAQSGVGRQAVHLAEAMKIGRESGTQRLRGDRPERRAPQRPPATATARAARTAATVAVSAVALGAAAQLLRRKDR